MTTLKALRRKVTRSEPFLNMLAGVTRWFILCYYTSLRVTRDVDPGTEALDPDRILYGFWHGRQFLLVPGFRDTGIVIMTDLSWAGEIQTRVLRGLGYNVVRGSSRRKPARALVAMKTEMERGHPAAFALDGPSGPPGRSKPGAVFLAARLGYSVVPVGTAASRRLCIPRTWCDYQLPLPFSRCVVRLGPPMVFHDESEDTAALDREVDRATADADRTVGRNIHKHGTETERG